MAEILNDRDLLLQRAAVRTVPFNDPGAIIIPGYTGIVLSKSYDIFYVSLTSTYAVLPERIVLTADLRGIPSNVPVTWVTGHYVLDVDPVTRIILGNHFEPGGSSLILTDTPDPLVKTVENSNYPRGGSLPSGSVRVTVSYGGQSFESIVSIFTMSG